MSQEDNKDATVEMSNGNHESEVEVAVVVATEAEEPALKKQKMEDDHEAKPGTENGSEQPEVKQTETTFMLPDSLELFLSFLKNSTQKESKAIFKLAANTFSREHASQITQILSLVTGATYTHMLDEESQEFVFCQ